MANALKTTVYLNAADYQQIKRIARRQKRAPAELVREAVSEYARRHLGGSVPSSIGIGHSGTGDIAERVDELLEGMGKRR